MKKCFNNEKNKSSVILTPEVGVKISGASVEPVVNDGAKTKPHHALRRSLRALAYGSTLKMTALAILLSFNLSTAFAGCSCDPDGDTLTISNCDDGVLSESSCDDQYIANNIIIGTGVTSIGNSAFRYASSLTSITIPDSVTSIGSLAFDDTGLTNIICKGDEKSCTAIADALEESGYDRDIISYQKEDNNGNTGGDDIGDVSGDFNPADCYNKGQVPYNNQCWSEYPFAKKRWTPAEANEWLHDGNDNFVVITFKK